MSFLSYLLPLVAINVFFKTFIDFKRFSFFFLDLCFSDFLGFILFLIKVIYFIYKSGFVNI